jgi:hypothetical protein
LKWFICREGFKKLRHEQIKAKAQHLFPSPLATLLSIALSIQFSLCASRRPNLVRNFQSCRQRSLRKGRDGRPNQGRHSSAAVAGEVRTGTEQCGNAGFKRATSS